MVTAAKVSSGEMFSDVPAMGSGGGDGSSGLAVPEAAGGAGGRGALFLTGLGVSTTTLGSCVCACAGGAVRKTATPIAGNRAPRLRLARTPRIAYSIATTQRYNITLSWRSEGRNGKRCVGLLVGAALWRGRYTSARPGQAPGRRTVHAMGRLVC